MRGPEDFGAAFTSLLDAAGATPDSVVRALNAAVSRSVLYDWKKGAHLPNDSQLLLQVVEVCLQLAGDDADLRGAPGGVQGWLKLLAEAKQTRDNDAEQHRIPGGRQRGGSSSLRDLNEAALAEVVHFLERHAKSLIELVAEFATGDPWSPLARRVRSTGGRYQTPQCVLKPKILPAPDLAVASARLDFLRAQRKALYDYINWGSPRGAPGYVQNPDDRLLSTISTLRGALDEIHGVRIVFVGEDVAARNDLGPDVSAPPDSGLVFNPRTQDPIITTVDVLPGSCHANIVVEGNPPAAVTPSGSIFVISVEAQAPRAVILQRARAVVLSRESPRRACFMKGITGALTPRRFDVDLDSAQPQLMAQGIDFPFTVSIDDPEQFWVQATAATNEIAWHIELDWITDGVRGTTVVNNGGAPFSLYPVNVLTGPDGQPTPLRTACDLEGHEEGCPALTLTHLFRESTSTFSPARDLDNECWFQAILHLREVG